MKTLDEVIKALEYCTGFDFVRCQDCPGYCEPDCGTQNDALHYLKEYRTILPLIPSLLNTALEVQKKGKTIG